MKTNSNATSLFHAGQSIFFQISGAMMARAGSKISCLLLHMIGSQLLLAAPVPTSREVNTRSPQLYKLDPKRISAEERRPWHPTELAAILGNQRGRHWQALGGIAFNPDGKQLAAISSSNISLPNSVYLWQAPNLRFQGLLPINATFAQYVGESGGLTTCGPDGIVRMWNLSGEKPRSRVVIRDVPIIFDEVLASYSRVALSPDGKKLVVSAPNGFNYYDFSASPAKCNYQTLSLGMSLLEATFSPDSRKLATLKAEVLDTRGFIRDPTIKKQEVTLWNVAATTPKVVCNLTGPIWWWGRISFSPDGKTIVCGSNIWDLSSDKPKFRCAMKGDKENIEDSVTLPGGGKLKDEERPLEGEHIEECLFLPDSRYALTSGNYSNRFGAYIRVRDMSQREPRILQTVWAPRLHSWYGSIALSADGNRLALGDSNLLQLWNIKDEKIQVPPPSSHGHTQEVKAISFGAYGNLLASVARDSTLRLWDLDGPRPRERLVQKQKFGASWDTVALAPDATKLATGFNHGGFTLWGISPSGLRVLAEHKTGGKILHFSPDSKTLFSTDHSGGVSIIDLSTSKQTAESVSPGRFGGHFRTEALTISPDGGILAVGGGNDLELWQRTDSGWKKRSESRARGDVKALAFGGRGGTLLVGGGIYKKPEVHLYDVTGDSPQPITTFTGLRDVALSVTASSTGKLFAATDQTGRVVVWSRSGEKLHEWTFPGPVHCVAFAPDGRHLALGNGDGTVYILRLTIPAGK